MDTGFNKIWAFRVSIVFFLFIDFIIIIYIFFGGGGGCVCVFLSDIS